MILNKKTTTRTLQPKEKDKVIVTYQKIGTQCVNVCIADLTKHGREVDEERRFDLQYEQAIVNKQHS